MRLTFDIETDGLDATKIWCLVIQDIDTGRIMRYADTTDMKENMMAILRWVCHYYNTQSY